MSKAIRTDRRTKGGNPFLSILRLPRRKNLIKEISEEAGRLLFSHNNIEVIDTICTLFMIKVIMQVSLKRERGLLPSACYFDDLVAIRAVSKLITEAIRLFTIISFDFELWYFPVFPLLSSIILD